jgi:hypothetical protein
MDEYKKVSGLDNAKQIWDNLKISNEGNDATMITKMELVEGELGRFAMKRGEEPTETYNRLMTLVNKIWSYRSTRWMHHDVVHLMLRSFTVIDLHLVNLIRENPRYTKISPEDILGKFVSGNMLVKEARYVDDIANGPLPLYEPQPVALKATTSTKMLLNKVAQVEASGLNEKGMAFVIKRFKTALKGCKDYLDKNKSRESVCASIVVRWIILFLNDLIIKMTRCKIRKGRRRRSSTGRQRARHILARNGTRIALHPTPTIKDLLPPPSTNHPFSPTSIILDSWQKIGLEQKLELVAARLGSDRLDAQNEPVFVAREKSEPARLSSL